MIAALANGNTDIVNILLEYNVDLSVCYFVVVTHTITFVLSIPVCQNPLYWAVEGEHVDIVEKLCKVNADVNQHNADVCTVQL